MKKIATRIAAAACAAITAACGAQALSASAFNNGHPYWENQQEYCESAYAMSRSRYFWINYGSNGNGNWAEGRSWSGTVKVGEVLGKGFKRTHVSNYNPNYWNNTNQNKSERPQSSVSGARAWARTLACSHFGFTAQQAVWLELPKTDFNYRGNFLRGDQVVFTNSHAMFITAINDDDTFVCSELRDGKIRWSTTYKMMGNYKLKNLSNNTTYTISYVARPVKEGDANGDGWVDRNDQIWVNNHNGNPYQNSTVYDNDVLLSAADVTGNWWLNSADASEIYSYMYEIGGYMTMDHRYVKAYW